MGLGAYPRVRSTQVSRCSRRRCASFERKPRCRPAGRSCRWVRFGSAGARECTLGRSKETAIRRRSGATRSRWSGLLTRVGLPHSRKWTGRPSTPWRRRVARCTQHRARCWIGCWSVRPVKAAANRRLRSSRPRERAPRRAPGEYVGGDGGFRKVGRRKTNQIVLSLLNPVGDPVRAVRCIAPPKPYHPKGRVLPSATGCSHGRLRPPGSPGGRVYLCGMGLGPRRSAKRSGHSQSIPICFSMPWRSVTSVKKRVPSTSAAVAVSEEPSSPPRRRAFVAGPPGW
jgi:hypothetical protein